MGGGGCGSISSPRRWCMALLLMVVFSVVALDRLVTQLAEQIAGDLAHGLGRRVAGRRLSTPGAWLLMLSVSYLVAMPLTAIVVLPLLLNHLAASDYPDLARLARQRRRRRLEQRRRAAVHRRLGADAAAVADSRHGAGVAALLDGLAQPAHLRLRRAGACHRRRRMAQPAPATRRRLVAARPDHGFAGLYPSFMGLLAPSLAAPVYLHLCLESLCRLRGDAVLSVSQDARSR